ncbi:HAD-IA family hydrolase [Pseudonocardia sp. N23]|uniref:HAD-IA family hydrolase n=1 Tax=Pseudonocardia sp. N23 TaxID=1987376 RepID=UPI000C032585|nr:HAD-IA family hydrolase [Pseudonocardia sp. N23]GAY10507.1 putative phosphatase YfbT [Pseudonocardia sp. N23]
MPITLDALLDRTFAAALFDMDGTLVDSTPAVVRCWTRWAQEHGVPDAALVNTHGRPAVEIIADVLPPDRVPAALARIVALELADTDGVVPLPGALDALRATAPAAIVTSCTRDLALARIAAAGLPVPAVLVTADDVRAGKPAPEPFLLAADRLGVDPTGCLVVEDAPAGLAAGRAAGATTLAVAGTHALADLTADAHAPDLSHVHFVMSPTGIRAAVRAT